MLETFNRDARRQHRAAGDMIQEIGEGRSRDISTARQTTRFPSCSAAEREPPLTQKMLAGWKLDMEPSKLWTKAMV